jgi:hypothetical protein
VADAACKERARVMRLAGTVNWKSGQHARIVEADFALPAYKLEELVGGLPDPAPAGARVDGRAARGGSHDDPYKRIAPPEYFRRLAGIAVPRGGLVRCPVPAHVDRHPSCRVGADAGQGWCCHAGDCGARGAIYDLASVLLGGPWGRELRGEAFTRARARVVELFGVHTAEVALPAQTRSPKVPGSIPVGGMASAPHTPATPTITRSRQSAR